MLGQVTVKVSFPESVAFAYLMVGELSRVCQFVDGAASLRADIFDGLVDVHAAVVFRCAVVQGLHDALFHIEKVLFGCDFFGVHFGLLCKLSFPGLCQDFPELVWIQLDVREKYFSEIFFVGWFEMSGALGSENYFVANVEYMVVAMPALEVWFIKWIGVEFDGFAWEHDYCCAFVPST